MRTRPWRARLEAIEAAGRTRTLRTLAPTGPVTGRLDGHDVLVACSNDYLGLAWEPSVQQAARGGGAGASRLISGSRPVHDALEGALGAHFGGRALLFPSGYQANLAVLSTICGPGQSIASDALNHASIIDGLRLSKARRTVVPHADPRAIPAEVDAVVVEGLYSMDGDTPPLAEYPTSPWLIVDEAHAVGCLGPGGRGVAAQLGRKPDALIGTFGKAYGASGAFVVGPDELIDLLINAGRSFIFTTAPPEPVAAMALAGLQAATDDRRARLAANAQRLRTALTQLDWDVRGEHHILPVVVGSNAMAISEDLLQSGVFAPGIRYPTVPAGQERIRFTASAAHTDDQLDRIAEVMGRPSREGGRPRCPHESRRSPPGRPRPRLRLRRSPRWELARRRGRSRG